VLPFFVWRGAPEAFHWRHDKPQDRERMPPLSRFKKFDARPILARGGEPYAAIRARVDALKPDQGLILVAPFLPSPLIYKLGLEGFTARVERGEAGEWIVYFWRETP
jgi:hypothetical protein